MASASDYRDGKYLNAGYGALGMFYGMETIKDSASIDLWGEGIKCDGSGGGEFGERRNEISQRSQVSACGLAMRKVFGRDCAGVHR